MAERWSGAGSAGEWLLGDPAHPQRVLLETVPVIPASSSSAQHRAGRAAAVAALQRAGSASTMVGCRSSGAPVFPDGYAGSVTHTHELAVAAVAPGALSIGVDLEFRLPPLHLHRLLLDEAERRLLWPGCDQQQLRRLFTAKEAAFKALTECHDGHRGLFWRVRLRPHGDGLWARAGDQYAVVRDVVSPDHAFAVALGVGASAGPWSPGPRRIRSEQRP